MANVHHLELRRRVDGLIYRFDRSPPDDGDYGYKRRDADVWILRRSGLDWVAVDPATGDVTGRPSSL